MSPWKTWCLVSAELLSSEFGAKDMTEEEMRRAFLERKADFQAIVRDRIENGWVDDEDRIFLTTRYTRLLVTFSPELSEWSEGLAVAKEAHSVLLEIIGPNAESVEVQWGKKTKADGQPVVSVSLKDPKINVTIRTSFSIPLPADPNVQRLRVSRLWSQLLQARSHQLILKSG